MSDAILNFAAAVMLLNAVALTVGIIVYGALCIRYWWKKL